MYIQSTYVERERVREVVDPMTSQNPPNHNNSYFLPLDILQSSHILTLSTSPFQFLYTMSWSQKTFTLPARSRGSYLITDHVLQEVPEIRDYKVGMLNLFVQHTSCALSLNENWDDDVRADMSDALDRIAPMDKKGNLYRHSAEGEDDMPVCLWE